MWAFIRTLRLFTKSLTRIASALESIRDLYRVDLESRGIRLTDPSISDEIEVMYSARERELDDE